MKQILCVACAERYRPEGRRMMEPASTWGLEEWQRLIFGIAKEPGPEHRVSFGTPGDMTVCQLEVFQCDSCGEEILTGQRCAAHTVWTGDEPPEWESSYFVDQEEVNAVTRKG